MQWLIDIVQAGMRVIGMFEYRGPQSAYDFSALDLVLDNNWHELDLSGIVPENAKCVLLNCDVRCTLANKRIDFRHPDAGNIFGVATLRTQLANARVADAPCVPCNANRVIEYKVNSPNLNLINLAVVGWWY